LTMKTLNLGLERPSSLIYVASLFASGSDYLVC